jgi:hypothetical protein
LMENGWTQSQEGMRAGIKSLIAERDELAKRVADLSTECLVLMTENKYLKESMDAIMKARSIENRYWEAIGGRG